MAKSETTGRKISSAASRVLRSRTSTRAEKAVAASALTQKVRKPVTRTKPYDSALALKTPHSLAAYLEDVVDSEGNEIPPWLRDILNVAIRALRQM